MVNMIDILHIDAEQALPPDVVLADSIVRYATGIHPQVITLNGYPGSGKTSLGKVLNATLRGSGRKVVLAGTDSVLRSRAIEAKGGDFSRFDEPLLRDALLTAKQGSTAHFDGYSSATGERGLPTAIGALDGAILILEGNRSAEVVESMGIFSHRLHVSLDLSMELAEQRVLDRDLRQKGGTIEETIARLARRRDDFMAYYHDLGIALQRVALGY